MNKIIILGNGFDLSHGLKTSFPDFIKHLIRKRISSDEEQQANEKLIGIINKSELGHQREYPFEQLNESLKLRPYLDQALELMWQSMGAGRSNVVLYKGNRIQVGRPKELLHIKNNFLASILNQNNIETWVDFEKTYYAMLQSCLNGYWVNNINFKNLQQKVALLNKQFSELRDEFLSYLKEVFDEKEICTISGYQRIFNNYDNPHLDTLNTSVLFLNFNYTKTLNSYSLNPRRQKIIHIHGELFSSKNPPIFGYGDETHEDYKKIEDLDDNSFLEHFKSPQYSKTKNYNELESYLSNAFTIEIIGHSCGVSDRVLLSHLFEHHYCRGIKLYHYGGMEGHMNIYMNISRHFSLKNKALQRKRMIGFDESCACPQAVKN